MRTLVVGAGAVGGYFGARLVAAGRDVTFVVRPQRAEMLRSDGLHVHPVSGDELIVEPNVVTARQLSEHTKAFDLVLLSVKAYAIEQALADIAPAVGPDTVVVPLLNGMRHVDLLRERFGPDRVVGGLCLVATQLDPDGSVRQLAPAGALTYGEFDGSLSDRMLAVDATLSNAGFRATLSRSIELDMWQKWVLLASGGALTTLFRGTVGEIVAAPGGNAAAVGIAEECFAVAAASGFDPDHATRERTLKALTEPGSSFTTSMYRDLVAGNDVEAEQIVGDLVRRGLALGVDVRLLSLAYTGLSVYRESLRR